MTDKSCQKTCGLVTVNREQYMLITVQIEIFLIAGKKWGEKIQNKQALQGGMSHTCVMECHTSVHKNMQPNALPSLYNDIYILITYEIMNT